VAHRLAARKLPVRKAVGCGTNWVGLVQLRSFGSNFPIVLPQNIILRYMFATFCLTLTGAIWVMCYEPTATVIQTASEIVLFA